MPASYIKRSALIRHAFSDLQAIFTRPAVFIEQYVTVRQYITCVFAMPMPGLNINSLDHLNNKNYTEFLEYMELEAQKECLFEN